MGRIIKQGTAQPDTATRPLDLQDFPEQARRLLEDARLRAQAMLAEARLQSEDAQRAAGEQARQAGFESGRKQGLEQGRQEGRAEAVREFGQKTATLVQSLEGLVRALEEGRKELSRRGRDELLDLACRVAGRIVHAAAQTDTTCIRETVARAIELSASRVGLNMRLHPRDLEAVREFLPALHTRFADLEPVKLVADESVHPGGCVLATREGNIDADLQTQLDELTRQLLGRDAEVRP